MFNHKPKTIFLISLFAIILLMAFAGNLLASKTSFRLSSGKIFSKGENTFIRLSSKNVTKIEFKMYKIDDPVNFFQSQKDVHYIDKPTVRPGKTGVEKATGFLKKFTEWRRNFFSSKQRLQLIELLGEKEEESVQESKEGKMEIHEKKEQFTQIPLLNDKNLVQKWTETISGNKDQWKYQDIEIEKNAETGVYMIEATSENQTAYTALLVTDLAMIIKQSPEKIIVFAVNKQTGEPIKNAQIDLMKSREIIKSKKTDDDGLATFDVQGSGSTQHVIMATKKDDFAISDPYFWYGSDSWGAYKVYTYTERPAYRPNQAVHFKSIVRQLEKGEYKTPEKLDVSILVRDSRGTELYQKDLITNDFGSIADSLTLGDEPPLGRYDIEVEINDNYYWGSFEVKEYKKPEYKVTVTTENKNYVFGEKIHGEVKANYYFGAPVQDATVRYYVYRSRYWVPWWYWYESDYSWYFEDDDDSYYYWDQEFIEEGEGKLNSEGKFEFSLQTETDYDENSIYKIEATVEDKSRRQIVGSKSVKVTIGEFYLSASSNKYFYKPDEKINLTIRSMDFSNNPVSTEGKIKIFKREWNNSNYKETFLREENFQTMKGKGVAKIQLDDLGYYRIEAIAYDSQEREITASEYLYVNSEKRQYWYSFYSDGVQIIPDKNSYDIGDVAHIMVISPVSNIHALVTIEGEEIHDYSVISVDGSTFIIDLPIEEKYSPNTFVKVSIVQGNEIYQKEKTIIVPPQNKFLDITITSDKEKYEPQETATFQITAKDKDGKPTDAEISLGIVDEAIYYIAKESTEDIQKYFYNKRWNKISTTSSFYFSFWGYSKEEKMAMNDADEAREQQAFADFKGGKMQEARIRRDFRDMIYWSPTIRTGSDGQETIKVKYPDNLTSWRATARAITKNTKVGSTTQNTITKQDLICRLETPRFFTQGDIVTLSTIVHNYLDTAKECKVSLKINNNKLKILDGQSEDAIIIEPNSEIRLDWLVEATEVGEVKVIGEALTNEKSDAMELTLPILPWGQYQGSAIAGELKDDTETREEAIYIPEEAIDGTISMRLNLSPTLVSTMLSALDYLIGYPYGCTEQTMSRFLPDVLVGNMLKDLGMENKEIMEKLPDMVDKGLERLTNYQHYDGGWGWWENDESDPFMTAYVIYGLGMAKQAGYEVPESMIINGTDWLLNEVLDQEINSTTRTYMLYAVAVAQGKDADKDFIIRQVNAIDAQGTLSSYSLALISLGLHEVGETQLAQEYLQKLDDAKNYQQAACYWGGTGQETLVHWQDDRIEITATAVRAISKLDPDSEYLFPAVRWLILNRKGNRWKSTKDTATILFSLVDYLKARGELDPDYQLTVYVNDEKVKDIKVKSKDSFQELGKDIIIDADKLKTGQNNVIKIEKNGQGALYYSSYTNYYNESEQISSTAHGIQIDRNYYKLIPTRNKRGTWVYAKQPINYGQAIKSGDEILVELSIDANQYSEYVMLEDPLPSGCEIIEDDKRYKLLGEDDEDDYWYDWGWAYWYSQREFRDEKATFFMSELWSEPQTITYVLRAEKPGYYRIMPAKIELMYMPEVGGNTEGFELEIVE